MSDIPQWLKKAQQINMQRGAFILCLQLRGEKSKFEYFAFPTESARRSAHIKLMQECADRWDLCYTGHFVPSKETRHIRTKEEVRKEKERRELEEKNRIEHEKREKAHAFYLEQKRKADILKEQLNAEEHVKKYEKENPHMVVETKYPEPAFIGNPTGPAIASK